VVVRSSNANSVASSLPLRLFQIQTLRDAAELDFQVAASGRIQLQPIIAVLHGKGANVRKRGLLGVLCVLQQRAGGAQSNVQPLRAKPGQVPGAELAGQQPMRGIAIEMPGRAQPGLGLIIAPLVLGQQQLGRTQAFQFCSDFGIAAQFAYTEPPASQIQPRQSVLRAVGHQRGEEALALPVEKRIFHQRSGSNDTHDLPVDRPL